MPQPLSTRDANLFRQVIRNYEDKQYKRGLKAAEQILKKNPNHGDTVAMKALILNGQGKSDEAFALGKEALRLDMKSHICWHVYGILYRSQKNFEEASKAYKFALRLEPDSPQIQRDLATLQVQMRDYAGYVQSRLAMLQARPQLRQNWTALAIAHHLDGNLAEAEHILTMYEETLQSSTPAPALRSAADLEHSEALLYKNSIVAETGDLARALAHLESPAVQDRCLDRLALLERRARYLTALGPERRSEAVAAWRALIERNADLSEYYEQLVAAMGLAGDGSGDEASVAARLAVFDEYAAKNPRGDAAKRLPLDFLTGDLFQERARKYVRAILDRGVPSLFANLKHLYADAAKRETLRELVAEYLQETPAPAAPGATTDATATANGAPAPASPAKTDLTGGHVAALYYLAQHYNYYMSRDLAQADAYCDRALALVPDVVDLHMTKARIWKHKGNVQQAAAAMDRARQLDTRDRYINSKATKYRLRNNENDEALATISLFTRPDPNTDALAGLADMQCIWYLTEDGEAYARRGNVGLALKRFHTIAAIFDTWQEDQFDFHTFSLRKGMVCAYIDMVRWEDRLREHPFYTRAALDAVRLYVAMHDSRVAEAAAAAAATAAGSNGVDAAGVAPAPVDAATLAEQKRAAKKAKKEALRAEKEAAEKAAKQDPNKATAAGAEATDADGIVKKKDDDPLGHKLAAAEDPLGEATKFLAPVLQFSPKSLDGQLLGFEVYLRRGKYLLALRCLEAARALDAAHPRVHEQSIALRQALAEAEKTAPLPAKVAEVLAAEFTAVPAGADLAALNAAYKAKEGAAASFASRMAALRVDKLLGKLSVAEAGAAVAKALAQTAADSTTTLAEAEAALETLTSWKADVGPLKAAAHSRWPDATVFAA